MTTLHRRRDRRQTAFRRIAAVAAGALLCALVPAPTYAETQAPADASVPAADPAPADAPAADPGLADVPAADPAPADVPVPAADPADDEHVVPASAYTLIGFSSQSPGYPTAADVDGTAAAVLTDVMSEAWTVAYTVVDGSGVATDPFPHWLALDTGAARELTAVQYAMKPGTGQAKGYRVLVSNDPAVAADPAGSSSWGDPVATGELANLPGSTQTISFAAPVTGRFVKIEFTSSYHAGGVVAASLVRVVASGDEPTGPGVDPVTEHVLVDGDFSVAVAEEFPQVASYTLDGQQLAGQERRLDTFRINGVDRAAVTSFVADGAATARYTSVIPSLDDLTITSSITIEGSGHVVFRIDDVTGASEPQVASIAIPGHSLLSVDSADPNAQLARTTIDTDPRRTTDQFLDITAASPVDGLPVGSPYAFLVGSGLAGGLWSNATPDLAQGAGGATNSRLSTQVVATPDGERRAEVSSGSWVWAPKGASDARVARYTKPQVDVILTTDRTGDGVDWQDAAAAFRDVVQAPDGAECVAERVVQRIPFNIASEGTNPFLKTLDNTKRLALATDDLGQWVLLKGYTSEGHDSANTDYGGNYNDGAGGLDDLNALVDTGGDYNADFAVHVNATEIYPAARSFSDSIIAGQGLGWGWLNQSYGINQRVDLGTGAVLDRFQQLRDDVPGLDSVYIDVYYSNGWLAEALADQLSTIGFEVASEWAYSFEGSSIWSHWANDKSYGDGTNRGITSSIIRFIGNGQRDVWNVDPILGGVNLRDFEGWSAKDDWNAYYAGIWTDNLPTKYLQHFDLSSWEPGVGASFDGGVEVTLDAGRRVVTQGGVEVLRADTYLLPWGEPGADGTSSPLAADKMYLFSASGQTREFGLTQAFAGTTDFVQYRLTDTGREKVADLRAESGALTVTAEAGVPYVVVPVGGTAGLADVSWGEHSGLDDPGFNAGDLAAWHAAGDASVSRTAKGDQVAVFGPGSATVSQQVTGLVPGERYTFGAGVEIGPQTVRSTAVTVSGDGVDAENRFSATPAQNWVGSDSKHGSFMQRADVEFVAPADGAVTVTIEAVAGDGTVTVDDARLTLVTTRTEAGAVERPLEVPDGALLWDFEDDVSGWGPFVKGEAGGLSDARTSLSRLHDPFTQQGWKNAHRPYDQGLMAGMAVDDVLGGSFSLKSHEENNGLVYRTAPATAPFVSGHAYEVSFDYQANAANAFGWVLGTDDVAAGSSTVLRTTSLPVALTTSRHTQTFTASCGSSWVGLVKSGGPAGADFVIDDVMVRDLGPVADTAACGTVTGTVPGGELVRGVPNRVQTTFTNAEAETVTNVGTTLTGVPDGWRVEVLDEGGNIVASVAPGESVTTVWLLTPPEDAPVTSVELGIRAEYELDCVELAVEGWVTASVAERAMVPLSSLTATASSEQPGSSGEGDVRYAIDGDPGTIWHTSWTPTPFPHWVQLDLGGTYSVDGLGYLNRTSGGANGRIKDYKVYVSADASSWTEVASGAFAADSPTIQAADFAATSARYVKLEALNAHNGLNFAAAAELRVYGRGGEPETGYVPAVRVPTGNECVVPAPVVELSSTSVRQGGTVEVTARNLVTPLIEVGIASTYRPLLTAVVADGTVREVVTIPADVEVGTHSIQVRVDGAVIAEAAITVTSGDDATTPPTTTPTTAPPTPTTPTSPSDGGPGGQTPGDGASSGAPGAAGAGPSGGLSATGASVVGLVGLVALLLLGGGVAVVLRRRGAEG